MLDINWNLLIGCSVGTIGFIEWIKKLIDKDGKLHKLYKFFPLILAAGVGYATVYSEFDLGAWIINSLIILSFSVLGYTTIVEFAKKKLESFLKK
jgi:hypothetical protein